MDYFSLLLAKDLGFIVKKIFLHLDGSDYDNCLEVSPVWRNFIKNQLLTQMSSKAIVAERKLAFDLFNAPPAVEELSLDDTVNELVWHQADEDLLLLHLNSRFQGCSVLVEWDTLARVTKGTYRTTVDQHILDYSWNKDICVGTPWNMDHFYVWDRSNYQMIQYESCSDPAGVTSKVSAVQVFEKCACVLTESNTLWFMNINQESKKLEKLVHVACSANFTMERCMDVTGDFMALADRGELTLWREGRKVAAVAISEVQTVLRVKFDTAAGQSVLLVGTDDTSVIGLFVNPALQCVRPIFMFTAGTNDYSNVCIVNKDTYLFRQGTALFGANLKVLKVASDKSVLTFEKNCGTISSCQVTEQGLLALAYQEPFEDEESEMMMECVSLFDLNTPNPFAGERAFHTSHSNKQHRDYTLQVAATRHGLVYRTTNSRNITFKHFRNLWPWDFPIAPIGRKRRRNPILTEF